MGTKYLDDVQADGVDFTRPYCRWPNIPVYSGMGDVNAEENWNCPEAGVY